MERALPWRQTGHSKCTSTSLRLPGTDVLTETAGARLAPADTARGRFDGAVKRNPGMRTQHIDRSLSIDPTYARAQAYQAWMLRGAGERAASPVSVRPRCNR